MFKKKFPSLSSLGSDGNTSFLRAARAGHLDKVLEHLDKNNVDINTSNANGLNALHLASKDGHIHVVTELLKRGANVDSATKKGNTALHIASLAGQEEVVRLLVDHGASVNVQSQNGFTPLYMAAQENHDNVVKFLLASGANQSLATEDGFTPLAVAMQQGHDKVVAVLLENDSRGKVRLPALHIAAKKDDCKAAALLLQNEHNPDVTSKSGFTPLHIASHYGNEGIANLLLSKGADVNYSAKHNITPLHVAAKWGKSNMVSLLLEKGANIESKTRDGLTPLHCAARSGHEQVVDMLLERGAPISSKTKNGLAPLHMSSQGDHVDAARILLYHRAPVDEVTVDYLTALHVAAHCGHARVAKLLLDRKADPNARALNGFTPLHIACKKNRIKVVELLLKHGASIEATTESGLTPLHVASFMGCMNIVIYLLQNEANPDVPTVRGETPLHLAARANQTDIIRILLRNGAQVDARAREQQTPLHIAARLGNVDIVMLLLQHGAAVDSTTKDLYTALHIAAKEGQDEVASVLVENNASLTATTKKGFTPLHLAAKYGNMKVARLLLQRDAPVDAQGKNGVTPLHVASHYDHQNVALLLLDKGASPHATAKNGHTPLHIAAKKNQMDIATTLLEYGAKANSESRAGFTPLHLSSQEGHTDMSSLLIEHHADTNHKAKNGLTPLHLCAQEDRVEVAGVLVKNGAEVDSTTKAGYTPLHVASHFGQLNMVKFLVQHNSNVSATTAVGYTPLHQAAQQGHSTIVNTLLENGAPPNFKTNQGQTALSIAQKLGYISVVETLKGVTEPSSITGITMEEKYKVVSPETMQETFISDSEDEGGEDTLLSEQPYRYLTVDEMKSLGDDSLPIDVTRDERFDSNRDNMTVPPTAVDDTISPQHMKENYSQFTTPDNVDIGRHPLHVGFLVSFLVDARGGAMRGCRHSGVRVIVPPRRASMPMRVTCRYLKRDKLSHPPPLMEGEALASRILELGPVGAKFLGPVIIEVPHFGSLRGKEREIVILRSDNGETWREHTVEASEEAVHDVLSHSFDKEELVQMEDAGRTTRILTTDFPHYFAVVTRVRQEVHAIGPEGGMVSSSVVPQVQAVFPQGALTKKIKVGLQAQPIPAELAAKLLGNRVAVSPIVTVEPRRRKFHKPITLTIPVPQAANKGMINQYSGDAPTLRLLCSITGGTTRAQWEDVTGSTPLTFVNDCVSFTTTVSARFWLMDCRNIGDATKMATELYREAIHVPFMAKFVVFAKRIDVLEARLRVFCMTDDKEDKTLEHQEHFTEVAKSRDVEVLEGKPQYVEFAANLVPVTKSGEQLQLGFRAFRENRLPFTVRVKDPHAEPIGRTLFMKEPKVPKGEPPQQPICVLNIVLPEEIIPETGVPEPELHKYSFIKDSSGLESYQRADLRLSDISNLLGEDWVNLAEELSISTSDINRLKSECPGSVAQQGLAMLRFWLHQAGNKASANTLEAALTQIGREDIVQQCVYNVDQTGFDLLKEELGPSRDSSLRRNIVNIYDKDNMKEAEAAEFRNVQERIIPAETIEKDDKEERKYVAEEKEVEEVKKSVSERRKEIEERLSQEKDITVDKKLEKRLSQEKKVVSEKLVSSVESTKIIDDFSEKEIAEEKRIVCEYEEGKEPSDLSFAEKRLSFEKGLKQEKLKTEDKYIDQKFILEEQKASEIKEHVPTIEKDVDETKLTFAEKRKSFEQSQLGKESIPSVEVKTVVEEKVKKVDSIEIKEIDTRKQVIGDEKLIADQRRDSELFEGVTETLGRLDMAEFTPQVQDLLSPKVSKTPPPSPAEFKEATEPSSWQTPASQIIPEKTQTTTDWATKSSTPGKLDMVSNSSQLSSAEKETKHQEKKIDKSQTFAPLAVISEKKEEPIFDRKNNESKSKDVFNISTKFIASEIESNIKSHEESSSDIEIPVDSSITNVLEIVNKQISEKRLPVETSDSNTESDRNKLGTDLSKKFSGEVDKKLSLDSSTLDIINEPEIDFQRRGNKESTKYPSESSDSKPKTFVEKPVISEAKPSEKTIEQFLSDPFANVIAPGFPEKKISQVKTIEAINNVKKELGNGDSIQGPPGELIDDVANVKNNIDKKTQQGSSLLNKTLKINDSSLKSTNEAVSSPVISDEKILDSTSLSKIETQLEVLEKPKDLPELLPVVTSTEILIEEKTTKPATVNLIESVNDLTIHNIITNKPEQILSDKSGKPECKDSRTSEYFFSEKTDGSKQTDPVPDVLTVGKSDGENSFVMNKELESTSRDKPIESLTENRVSDMKVETKLGDLSEVLNPLAEASKERIDESLSNLKDSKLSFVPPDELNFVPNLKETETSVVKKITGQAVRDELKDSSLSDSLEDSGSLKDSKPDKKISDSNKDSSSKQSDQLTDILIDMLIDQETSRSPSSTDMNFDQSMKLNLSDKGSTPKDVPEIINESIEQSSIIGEILYHDKINTNSCKPSLSKEQTESTTEEKLVRVEKSDRDKNEPYGEKVFSYVTTPTMQRRKIGGSQRLSREERPALMEVSYLRDESSEESDEEHYIVTEPPEKEKLTGQNQRKVQFRVESEEDPSWQESDEPEEEIEFEEVKDDGTKITKQLKISRLGEKDGKEKVIKEFSEEMVFESPNKEERKIRRVERHFERMASETLEADPVANVGAEGEFQRMVSQLSTEEVNECLQVWDEGGLTPSSELDSKDVTEGDLDEEYEQLPEASAIAGFEENINVLYDNEASLQDVPSSVFWSFTNKPLRSSAVIPEDLAIPLEQPSKLKVDIKSDSAASTPNLESPLPILKINTLGQSYSFDSPEKDIEINSKEFISHEGGQSSEESGSTATEIPGTRERDEIQTEQSEALESPRDTDKITGSADSGASPGPGLPPAKK